MMNQGMAFSTRAGVGRIEGHTGGGKGDDLEEGGDEGETSREENGDGEAPEGTRL
jgi:hypothetical protein